jgi:multidrug efflux system membrane fusion protein
MLRKFLLLTALPGAGVLGIVLFSKFSAEAVAESRTRDTPSKAVPVQVAAARTADLPVVLSGLGSVMPSQSVIVRSRVAGQLVRVAFHEGELVEKGQLLAEIDPRPFQARVAQTDGQLARDRALLANARTVLARSRVLAQGHLVSAQDVENQTSLVEQYQAAERISEGVHAAAELDLGFTRVSAPIRGRVGFRQLDVGNNVDAASPLVVIHGVQPIAVVFTLPEDDVSAVLRAIRRAKVEARGAAREQNKDHRALEVEAWDKGSKTLLAKGTLLTIDNQIDTATGTFKLKAMFDNEEGELFPNQFVNVRFVADVLRGATVVPMAAVQRGRDGPFAYVVGPDQVATVRKLIIGATEGGESVVREGLAPGELVVVQGIDQVREGARVKPSAREEHGGSPAKLGLSGPLPQQP